jgi:hypothetical protein
MKKTVSLILAIAMLFSIGFSIPVGAEDNAEYKNMFCTVENEDGLFLAPSGEGKGKALTVSDEAEQWRFKSYGTSYSFIDEENLAADVNGASKNEGVTIIQWTPSGASNQKWTVEEADNGYCYIISLYSQLYLTEEDGVVTQEALDEEKSQLWKISIVGEYEPAVEKMLESDTAKALDSYKYERLCDYLLSGGEFNELCYNKVETMIEEQDYFSLSAEEQAEFIESCFSVVSTDLMYGSMATKLTPEVEVVKTEKRDNVWLWYSKPSESAWVYTIDITDEESDETHEMEYISVEANDEEYAKVVGQSVGCFEKPVRECLNTFFWTAANEGTWNGGGGQIWNNTGYRGDLNNMVQMFAHELGHVMDSGKMNNNIWYRAIAQDMVPVTGYGNTTRWEDLAEFSRMYLLAKGDDDRIAAIEKTYPARTLAYKALLYSVDSEFYSEYEEEYKLVTEPIGDYESGKYVKIALDGKYFTDVNGALELCDEKDSASDWQTWIVYESDEGASVLQNKATGKYITFEDGVIGAKLSLGEEADSVGIKSEGDGYYLVSEWSGFKVNKDLETALDNEAVLFNVEDAGEIPYAGEYKLSLSVNGSELGYDEETGLGIYSDEAETEWKIVPADRGYYNIVNVKTGKLLDVSGGSSSNGAKVILYDRTGGENQQFAIVSNGEGTYSLVARHSGLKLAVGVNDNAICQADGKGYYTRWTLVKD